VRPYRKREPHGLLRRTGFIDVPYDASNATYQAVQAFLEYPDGTIRFDDVNFWVVSIERAMENSHHDEPGFWDRRAESF
jgi:hypothetical protein